MRRTWRGWAARVNWYFLEGNAALVQAKAVLYVAAALKILGLDLLTLMLLSPVVYAAHVVAGYVWVRWGWYRELTEVPTADSTNPVQQWHLYMQVRLAQHLGIATNGMDLSQVPHEVQQVLMSYHQPEGR